MDQFVHDARGPAAMTLQLPKGPRNGLSVVRKSLQQLLADSASAKKLLGDVVPESTEVTEPIPYYTIPLSAIVPGVLGTAQLEGWRYLLVSPEPQEEVVAAVDLEKRGDRFRRSSIWRGPLLDETVTVIRSVEDASEHDGRELRILELPGIYFVSVWLPGAGAVDDDLYFPLTRSLFPNVEGDTGYTAKELADRLVDSASQVRDESN